MPPASSEGRGNGLRAEETQLISELQDFDGPIQTIFLPCCKRYFGRVGRIASEEVVLHLMPTKCIPILLYGLEACPMRKTDLNSLDFVVNRFFMKLLKTQNR